MSGGWQPKPSVIGLKNPLTGGSGAIPPPTKKIVVEIINDKKDTV